MSEHVSAGPPAQPPRVTIGLPVYNGEKLIRKALDALLAQTFTDFEIVISDNASTDSTPTICREYAEKDSRIRIIRHEQNGGAVWNFLFVLTQATGEYFMWAACDDDWTPEFVRTMADELDAHSGAGVSFCAIDRIRETGDFYDHIGFTGNQDPNRMSPFRLAYAIAALSYHYLYIYGLFRTAALRSILPIFPQCSAPDRVVLCAAALAFPWRYVDRVLHIRTENLAQYKDRNPGDPMSQVIRSPFRFLGVPVVATRYMFPLKAIPVRRKLYLPVILVRAFLSASILTVTSFIGALVALFLGVERKQALRRWLSGQ